MSARPYLLVIDDDAPIRRFLHHLLLAEGFTVDTATDGEDGLGPIEECRPDLILLDLMMPRMTGWQVYGWLQVSGHADIPVIVMTAGERLEAAQQSLPSADVVPKPFDLDDLVARIRRRLHDEN